MAVWREDILGDGFECTDLELGVDDEGPAVATLVRAKPTRRPWLTRMFHGKRRLADTRVLYVHGWSDYFFQRDLAAYWTAQGATFYALDLRKYGRSLREGQTAGYCDDLEEYHEEIELALAIMREDAGEPATVAEPDAEPAQRRGRLILMGHSTGGLVLSLWADRNPGQCDALILNSPWLEFQLAGPGRNLLKPLVNLGARVNAREMVPQLDYGFYTRAQRLAATKNELDDVNLVWRPERSHPVLTGWLRAVLDGHARVSHGLSIETPVGVLLSARSAFTLRWNEECARADTVLEVDEIARAALKLGPTVTMMRIDGGLHDVFLSAAEPRAAAYTALDRWVTGWNAAYGR
ncbi:alpha-beta hydrolase superfamily lysophospholipase [Leucobacter exalbidus]|uniref:Alpha-beta hydrolase superfamily lysophospholipase n=1 Tax=Leucobacter exalbidus TaxID=662960 RepID=A0A940PS81_9MICO|nr:alpha/beta hydrolase [Leucobacter exalbidus]MBP1326569.1 alpha-beta hydrolase superfamily lysophospholipase [Leucobacter exalbidus]